MTSRTLATTFAGRSSSMRRQRRRATTANHELCRTNGCATFLQPDALTGRLVCPICGYERPAS